MPEILQRDSARTVLCALTVFVQTIYPSHALLVAVVLCGCCGDQDSAGGRRRACGRACARVSSASRAFHARPGRAHARPRQGLDIGTGARPPQHEPPHLVDLAVVDKLLDEELAFILRKGIWEKGHAVVGERCGQPRSVCRSGAGPVGRRAERGVRGGCLHGARPGTALTAGARTRWGTCALAGGAAGYGDEGERQPDAVRAAHRRPSCFFFFLRNRRGSCSRRARSEAVDLPRRLTLGGINKFLAKGGHGHTRATVHSTRDGRRRPGREAVGAGAGRRGDWRRRAARCIVVALLRVRAAPCRVPRLRGKSSHALTDCAPACSTEEIGVQSRLQYVGYHPTSDKAIVQFVGAKTASLVPAEDLMRMSSLTGIARWPAAGHHDPHQPSLFLACALALSVSARLVPLRQLAGPLRSFIP